MKTFRTYIRVIAILVFSIVQVSFIGCEKEEFERGQNKATPPKWIWGQWIDTTYSDTTNSPYTQFVGYEFTKSTMYRISFRNGVLVSEERLFSITPNGDFEEIKLDSTYKITHTYQVHTYIYTDFFEFELINDSVIADVKPFAYGTTYLFKQ